MALHVVNDIKGINHKERFPLSYKDYERAKLSAKLGHNWERLPDKKDDNKEYYHCERCQTDGFRHHGDQTMIVQDALFLETCDEIVAKSLLVG